MESLNNRDMKRRKWTAAQGNFSSVAHIREWVWGVREGAFGHSAGHPEAGHMDA